MDLSWHAEIDIGSPSGVFENAEFVQMVDMVKECYVKVSKAEPEVQEITDSTAHNGAEAVHEKVQQYIESATAHVKRFIQCKVKCDLSWDDTWGYYCECPR